MDNDTQLKNFSENIEVIKETVVIQLIKIIKMQRNLHILSVLIAIICCYALQTSFFDTMKNKLFLLVPAIIFEIICIILFHKLKIKKEIYKSMIEAFETGTIDITYTETDDDGKIINTITGDEVRELLFGFKNPDSISECSENEKYKIVISNIHPIEIISIEEYLEENQIPLSNKCVSKQDKTITLLFKELNDAKAARNILYGKDYQVGHAEPIEQENIQ